MVSIYQYLRHYGVLTISIVVRGYCVELQLQVYHPFHITAKEEKIMHNVDVHKGQQ